VFLELISLLICIHFFFLFLYKAIIFLNELIAAGVMTADYSLLDGTGVGGGLKLTGALDRSRYRHEPYPRYHSTKVVT
jgi:hypothetical protein